MKKEKIIEELKKLGRWANEDLYLEYSYCAIEEPKLKEHCISLWIKIEDVVKAIQKTKQETSKVYEREKQGLLKHIKNQKKYINRLALDNIKLDIERKKK